MQCVHHRHRVLLPQSSRLDPDHRPQVRRGIHNASLVIQRQFVVTLPIDTLLTVKICVPCALRHKQGLNSRLLSQPMSSAGNDVRTDLKRGCSFHLERLPPSTTIHTSRIRALCSQRGAVALRVRLMDLSDVLPDAILRARNRSNNSSSAKSTRPSASCRSAGVSCSP